MNLLTADDIAELLRCTADHVRDRITKRKGFPPAYRLGGLLRWERAEVLRWIDAQRVSPAARRSSPRSRGSTPGATSGQSDRPSGQAPKARAVERAE